MKYYKIKIFVCVILITLFSSCKEDDQFEQGYDLGANVLLETTSLNNLDENHTMEFSITTNDNVSVTKIEVYNGDTETKVDATISGKTASFNSSLFGTLNRFKVDDKETKDKDESEDKISSVEARTISTLSNGETIKRTFTIKIAKALSLVDEISAIKYGYVADSENDTLSFKTTTKSAVISSVTLNWKEGKNGTYIAAAMPVKALTLNVKGDTIPFVNVTNTTTYGYGLNVKDTLYYRFIATSGTLKDTLEVSIPIISQTFETVSSATISSNLEMNKLNLETGTVYDDTDAEEKGEIKFKSTSGFAKEGTTVIDFVKVGDLSSESDYVNTKAKLFTEKDLLVAKRLYDAGTQITETATTTKDDLFIYKITRNVVPATDPITTVIKYGMIKIGDIVTTNEEMEINIKYGEGEIK